MFRPLEAVSILLPDDSVLSPDAALVRKARWQAKGRMAFAGMVLGAGIPFGQRRRCWRR